MRSPIEQVQTPDERIAELWRQGLNTYEIAERLTSEFREQFTEAQVCRVLARRERKGGAE